MKREEKIWRTQHKNTYNKHNALEVVTTGRAWYNAYLKNKYVNTNFRMSYNEKK
jgi:hypothetical protein